MGQYEDLTRLVSRILDPSVREALVPMLRLLASKEPVTMADITQALGDLNTAVSGVASRLDATKADLQGQIDVLKASGTDTAALQAAADSIESSVSALNAIDVPVAPAAEPAPPVAEPTPPVDPAPADPAPVEPPADPAP